MAVRQRQLPKELADAIESGDITQEQLRQLIKIEAGWLGLSFDEALERARTNTLPKDALGTDIQFLIMSLRD